MTDLSPDEAKHFLPLELSDISPEKIFPNSLLHGTITIKWPYSPSSQKLTFILVDPDPRKRASGGQVKITLLGQAAEVIDGVDSGEEISLAIKDSNAILIEPESPPDRAKWHLTFAQGCILLLKDHVARLYPPLTACDAQNVPPFPPLPTPTLPSLSQSPEHSVWKTPFKRKFSELTDHAISSSLADEEEWFGSEPRRRSGEPRRFSGRMRYIGLKDFDSTPVKHVSDENSFAPTQQANVLPDLVLRAQNMVSEDILSEKLLHPPQRVGTGVEDVSLIVMDGSVRPASAGLGSTGGGRGERSFEVFHDERDAVAAVDEDIIPQDLVDRTQIGQWGLPDRRLPEDRSPVSEANVGELETEQGPLNVTRREPSRLRLTNSDGELEYSEEEGAEDSSDERRSGSDQVDYEYPEQYADDDGLFGEEYKQGDDDLHHARYYSRRSQMADGEELLHSDEAEVYSGEEVEDEGLESEDESLGGYKQPEVVDLTLDSSEGEQSGKEDEGVSVHCEQERYEDFEEEMDAEEEEDERFKKDSSHESSWKGINPLMPFTDPYRQSQQQHPQANQPLNLFLDPSLMTPALVQASQSMISHNSNTDLIDSIRPEAFITSGVSSSFGDILSQSIDPMDFRHQSAPAGNIIDPSTAALLDTVFLAIQPDSSTLMSHLPTQPLETGHALDAYPDPIAVSTGLSESLETVDTIAEQEFLTGLLPMRVQVRESGVMIGVERKQSTEFLPHIVPDVSFQPGANEYKISSDLNAKKYRTEIDPQAIIEEEGKTQALDISLGEPTKSNVSPKERLDSPCESPTTRVDQIDREVIADTTRYHSPSLPPLSDDWRVDGLTTPLGYYPSLVTIVPPSLRAQKENRLVDLMGVIRQSDEIAKTKGPDYILPIHIVDPSTGMNQGLSVLLFRPHKSALPTNPTTGSVIMLTDMKIQSHQYRAQARTTESSGWILFPPNEDVQDSGPPVEYGEEELLMVKQLQSWWRRSLEKGKGKEIVTNGQADRMTIPTAI